MTLHVADFSGGVVSDGSSDSQRTNEVLVADSLDIGHRGSLIVASDVTDYLLLKDNGVPDAWTRLWNLLEASGFNFSKVVAVGEGLFGAIAVYVMTSFNREGEASPYLWASGGSRFGYRDPAVSELPPISMGVTVMGAEFAGVFPMRLATPGTPPAAPAFQARIYLINIGAREGTAPIMAPGLYVVFVQPPSSVPGPQPIGNFDALGTGASGMFTVPAALGGEAQANGGTKGRQLYFRGIMSWNNHVLGWGYDAKDETIVPVTGLTNANPGNVTAVGHGLVTGQTVVLRKVGGMVQVNGRAFVVTVTGVNNFTIGVDTTAYGVYTALGDVVIGNGDGPTRVMFCNLGRPLAWGNDNIAALGVDRLFTDTDAIVLGDAGEIIRAGVVFEKKAVLGTNRGLHYIAGYGRDSFLTDGANAVMNSYNVIGPHCLKEGPDKKLYGVADLGLWSMESLGSLPEPHFEKVRDYKGRSNGYWDLIWTDYTRTPTDYPGVTNQDLVWLAMDRERQQVLVGIPWCSINNGYGYGTDTVVIKFSVRGGGFTRQLFPGVQYTAAGYFRAISQQAAMNLFGTATAGQATVKRFGYKEKNAVLGWTFDAAGGSPVLPSSLPVAKLGPYAPFGPDKSDVVKRLYLVMSWDKLAMPVNIAAITNANPAVVTTASPHGFKTGQKVDIYGFNNMNQVVGGPYTITVTGALTFSLDGINSTAFTAYGGPTALIVGLPLIFDATLAIDEKTAQGQVDAAVVGVSFVLSVRPIPPRSPTEGDLWLDISETDQNIGNAVAGSSTLATGGYLMRVRHDSQPVLITGATKANPCVVTSPTHGFRTGERISIRGVLGMVELNNPAVPGPYTKDYTVVVVDGDHFSLVGIDSTGYTTYTSGGTASLAWTLIPGQGGQGERATIPLPVIRQPGIRYTLRLAATTLSRRYQLEGLGISPGSDPGGVT